MKRFFVVIASVLLLSSCKKESKNYAANIAILNGVPESSGIHVFAGDQILADSAVYGNFSSYQSFGSGTYIFGWQLNQVASPDSMFTTDIQPGSNFTLILYDTLAIYKGFLIKDVLQQTSVTTKAFLRFLPMVQGADTLRVKNDTLKVLAGPRYTNDFAKTTSYATFSTVDTFKTKLRLFNNSDLIDSLPNTELLPGKNYTLFAIGVMDEVGEKRPRLLLKQQD